VVRFSPVGQGHTSDTAFRARLLLNNPDVATTVQMVSILPATMVVVSR
jgi:hypothetical protein